MTRHVVVVSAGLREPSSKVPANTEVALVEVPRVWLMGIQSLRKIGMPR